MGWKKLFGIDVFVFFSHHVQMPGLTSFLFELPPLSIPIQRLLKCLRALPQSQLPVMAICSCNQRLLQVARPRGTIWRRQAVWQQRFSES
ncbi:hypothetical protein QQF64_029178 [Cirrhinus molitorella]|uniref:F-box domain-containing protein n=1 Tax=Cirrhinus molitorella TaxID=172907 RepID=A0ABR3N925_9TELE